MPARNRPSTICFPPNFTSMSAPAPLSRSSASSSAWNGACGNRPIGGEQLGCERAAGGPTGRTGSLRVDQSDVRAAGGPMGRTGSLRSPKSVSESCAAMVAPSRRF
eukprot:363603-Prorocentrum_minimum.AAC.1